MVSRDTDRAAIQTESLRVERSLKDLVEHTNLVVVKAPPGSGKTYLLLKAVDHAAGLGMRVAVGAQTNSQANDICRRLANDYPHLSVHRFAARGAPPRDLGPTVHWIKERGELPHGPAVVVSTIAKWSLTNLEEPFDILMVDEAWQMAWSDFMLCGRVAPRFVLIGDPGQIPPVVPIPVRRWETSPRAPHQPAPELILADTGLPFEALELPACRRLPFDSVDLIRPFYDFEFAAWAQPGERRLLVGSPPNGHHPADPALEMLRTGSVSALTLPTPPEGPPLELDHEVAILAAKTALRVLEREATAIDDESGDERRLDPEDIGLVATHRIVNTAMQQALPPGLRNAIRVDTPERWQGLERKLMIAVHPLSGVTEPSAFDLETGRLCVMTSRHRAGLVIVARDHIPETLQSNIPAAEQAVGRPDISGRGHEANLEFWETMTESERVVSAE